MLCYVVGLCCVKVLCLVGLLRFSVFACGEFVFVVVVVLFCDFVGFVGFAL